MRRAAAAPTKGAHRLALPLQTKYSKGVDAIPPPKTIFKAESELMGQFDFSAASTGERAVPKSPAEFVASRTNYNAAMSSIRKELSAQWTARRAREAKAVAAYQAGVRARMEATAAVRAERREQRAQVHETDLTRTRAARSLRRVEQVRANARASAAVDERRRAWLALLEADAAGWVTPETIDERITPATFAVKVAWQFAMWFEAKDAKRRMLEASRRTQAPGVPLQEVSLDDDDEYATDWESDIEPDRFTASAIAAMDANAARDPTGKTALALATARRAARAAGEQFAVPAFDDDGRPLRPAGTHLERLKVCLGCPACHAGSYRAQACPQARMPHLSARPLPPPPTAS